MARVGPGRRTPPSWPPRPPSTAAGWPPGWPWPMLPPRLPPARSSGRRTWLPSGSPWPLAGGAHEAVELAVGGTVVPEGVPAVGVPLRKLTPSAK
jgi:hypothetical protein